MQLVAERTGFHPVSPAVFRPRPERRFGARRLPPHRSAAGLPSCQACGRRLVRASAQAARELARARGRRRPSARGGGDRADRQRPQRSCGGAHAAGVPRPRRGTAVTRAACRGQDQPRARRRAATRRRQARARDRLPARCALGPDRCGAFCRSCASRGSPTTRSCGRRSNAWPTATGELRGADREADSRRRRARRRQLRRGHGVTARERVARRATQRRTAPRRSRGTSAPTCRTSWTTGRSSARVTAPSCRRSSCLRTTGSSSSSRGAPTKTSTGAVYVDLRHAKRRGRLRRTPRSPAARTRAGQAST